jgi:hypothetical protein
MAQRGFLASVVLVASVWMSQVRARVAFGLGFPERERQKGAQRQVGEGCVSSPVRRVDLSCVTP